MSAPHDDLQDVNPAQSSQVPDSAAEQAASAVDQSASSNTGSRRPPACRPEKSLCNGVADVQPSEPRSRREHVRVFDKFFPRLRFSHACLHIGDNRRPRRTEQRQKDGQHTQGLHLHGPRLRRGRPRDSLGRPLGVPVLRRSSMRRTRPTAPTGSRPLDGPSIAQVLSSSSSWQPEFLATRVLSSSSSWQSGFLVI